MWASTYDAPNLECHASVFRSQRVTVRRKIGFKQEGEIMRRLLFVTSLMAIGVVLIAAQAPSTVTYADHDKVANAIANGGQLANGPDFAISMAKRNGPGQVEVHDRETDTFYVIDGEATFVTGGTMIGGRVSRPNQQLGTDIQGGQTHRLTKGDVIVIPAGIPHWFKEVQKPFTYYMVKVIKP
jgi:mannose-6-phosphate isomerase-like protein (cupin superfamily)